MKQFNLSEWFKDRSRKVTTRLGNREVRIICWDRKNNDNRPIITLMIDPNGNEYITFHTENGFVDDKEKYIDKRDLFFADEEEELTEFEKELNRIVQASVDAHSYMDKVEIHHYAKGLLDLARKELEKEYRLCNKDDSNWEAGCKQGKQDVLKDLPKLEKTKDCIDPTIPIMYTNTPSMKSYVEYHGYKLCINDVFEKLPKEE